VSRIKPFTLASVEAIRRDVPFAVVRPRVVATVGRVAELEAERDEARKDLGQLRASFVFATGGGWWHSEHPSLLATVERVEELSHERDALRTALEALCAAARSGPPHTPTREAIARAEAVLACCATQNARE